MTQDVDIHPAQGWRNRGARGVEFSVLGPLTLRDADGTIALDGPRRRALLLRLLTDANRMVPADVLAEDLWDGSPPATAVGSLQSHISHLRRIIGRDRIVSQARGYLLRVADDEIDRVLFEQEVAVGRAAFDAGDASAAVQNLSRALARWRGTALADVGGAAWAIAEVSRLDELRGLALEHLLDAHLSLGQLAEVIGLAEVALAEHPLRERLWGSYIMALFRAGRQADALRAYQRVRTVLADELGLEPSAALRKLEAQVLAQDPVLFEAHSEESLRTSSDTQRTALPTGVVTFLLTDIVGSTRLWEDEPDAMHVALGRHDELIHEIVRANRGVVVKARGEGDSTFSVFERATDAAAAALAVQTAVRTEGWPTTTSIAIRVALHTGEAFERDGDYFGPALNRVARLRATGDVGQVLLTQATATLVIDHLPRGRRLTELGLRALRDLERPEPVYLLTDETTHAGPRGQEAGWLLAQSRPGDLHRPSSSFVGREDLVGRISELLRTTQLVTLTGPGGVGKTRVALEVVDRMGADFPDGVWFADLSSLTDPALVDETIASTIGAPRMPGRPPGEAVVDRLRGRAALVVLDNCEHLLDAVGHLVARITSAGGTRLLLTSREHLGIHGEHTVVVEPLALPGSDDLDPAELADCEAVRLFVERACGARSEFQLTPANSGPVVRICRRVDGLPLAVELAAARVRSMTPGEIEQHLDDRLELLQTARSHTSRHRRLLDTIEWSYDLLDEGEQRLFRALGCFSGGCDLPAVLGVVGADPAQRDGLIGRLDRLVEKSLVVADAEPAGTRYRMLETIRSFARVRLDESAEAPGLRRHHAEHFASVARDAGARLVSPDEVEGVDLLEQELDNLRAAQRWAIDQGDIELACSLIVPLLQQMHPIAGAAAAAAHELIAMPGAEHHPRYPFLVACAIQVVSELGGEPNQGQHDELERVLALAEAQQSTDCPHMLNVVAASAIYLGDVDRAREASHQGAVLARELGDHVDEAANLSVLTALQYMAREDCADTAQACLSAALRVGSPSRIAVARFMVAWAESDPKRCLEEFERALVLAASVRNDYTRATGLNMLAVVHARRGDHQTALPVLLRGAELSYECGERMTFAINMNMIAGVMATLGNDEIAWLLRTRSPALGHIPLMDDAATAALTALHERLGPARAAEIAARAEALTDREVLALTRQEIDDVLGSVS